MATDHVLTKNDQKTNIIILTENNEFLNTIISMIEKAKNCDELSNVTKHITPESNEQKTQVSYKRRKADLTCVICNDKCSGYNFNVISCESCKSFFHRNISQNLDNLKCLTNSNNCDIKFQNRRKMCRRCRLAKCLSVGMKCMSSADEKLNKQRQIEENRRSTKNEINTLTQTSFTNASLEKNELLINEQTTILASEIESTMEQLHTTDLSPVQENIPVCQQHSLTFDEHNLLNSIQISYEKNFRFSTIQNDTSVFDRIIDRRSGLLYTATLFYDISLKIITFIRSIPEFELLNEQDRFILVKYNSPLVFFMRLCLHYDMQKDLIIDCQAENEERAMLLKQLSYYCFGDPLELLSTQVLRSIKKITDDDPNILQLMLIILTFAKSVSAEDILLNEQPILVNSKQVYEIQSIYTNLLFRYMTEKYSTYNQAIRHYSQLIQKILQMQMLIRNYQEFLHEQLTGTSDDEVNPIIKSILRLC